MLQKKPSQDTNISVSGHGEPHDDPDEKNIQFIISDKSHIHLHGNVIELAILCFLKSAVKRNQITKSKQGDYLIAYFFVAMIQLGFIVCMFVAIVNSHENYKIHATEFYTLVLAKFFACCALHLMLYPEVARSMMYMKYVSNHTDNFTHPNVAFLVATSAQSINVLAEAINLYMLLYQHSVEHTIIHFVALEIIVEIPHFYANALISDQLKVELFKENQHLHVHNKGSQIQWKDRSCYNKAGRIAYRFHRALYVSVIFYF